MDNDLTHIAEDHFEIKLIARLLDQIYVVQPPTFPPRYDDAPPDEYEYSQSRTSTDGTRPSAPQLPEHYIRYLPGHKYKVWLHDMNLLHKCFMTTTV